jgi:MraZ protein
MGEYRHALDDKGRLTLPARLREGLGQPFVATRGFENCLFLYPMAEWEALEARIRALPFNQANVRAFARLFFAGAAECRTDAQGRVLVPPQLREYARLEREAVILGVNNRVEVWSEPEWERYAAAAAKDFATLAEQLQGLGL